MIQGSFHADRTGKVFQVIHRPAGHQSVYNFTGISVTDSGKREHFTMGGQQVDRSSPWLDLVKPVDNLHPDLLRTVGDMVDVIDFNIKVKRTCIIKAVNFDLESGPLYQLEHMFKDDGASKRVSPHSWLRRDQFVFVTKATQDSLIQLSRKVFVIPSDDLVL